MNIDTLFESSAKKSVLMTSSGATTTQSNRGPRESHQVFTMSQKEV